MRILLYGEDRNRATDGNIVQGTEFLLKLKYPNAIIDYIQFQDFYVVAPEYFNSHIKYDKVVLCGTPWIWDKFYLSTKYRNWLTLKAAHPEASIIMLGIGSCLNLDDIKSSLVREDTDIPFLKELTVGATVVVRDTLAHDILSNAGVHSILLPCPSFWCTIKWAPKTKNLLIWCDPRQSISKCGWANDEEYNAYCEKFVDFYYKYNPNVYCVHENEKASAVMAGLPEPMLLGNLDESHEIIRNSEYVLSGRVHCAVPAWVSGAITEIVAIDSRAGAFIEGKERLYYNYDSYLPAYLHII